MNAKLQPARLHAAMRGHVERGDIPGIVTLIAHGDDVQVDAIGKMTVGDGPPMRRDTVFRIASITKPIVAAATMALVDDGRLHLDDAVDRWLPELADRQVLRHIGAALDDTVPAVRPITVRDVLNSSFGFGSVMAMPGTHPIQQPIAEGFLGGDGPPNRAQTPATDEWMRRLDALPLMQQPGERWLYNTASDVQGVLVERASGQSLEDFLQERLFDPLGMTDTSFTVPAFKLDRLPGCYWLDDQSGKLEVFDSAANPDWSQPPAFASGAGGLVSTVDDYHAFCRMLLDKGRGRGGRVLSEAAVDAMTRDQLTPAQRQGGDMFFGGHSSWGFGMAVNIAATKPWTVPGRFGWDGGFGTSAWSDPRNDFIGILLTQRLMDSPEPPAVFTDFWTNAYRSLAG
ncbi:serine hydrolase domain-containing protein [Variovorax robiniae]|uniref:Serine hydrolase domain-containing protein n=1 Tax=Variovorax robiniae TaxID=1836199 RepID=A0ABU8XEZ4_9BURK